MLRIMWRWMDSWSVNSVELTDAQNDIKDNKIQWFRILPFIILHLSYLAIFWVGISWFAVGFMLFFYLIRMFAITGFFHRYLSHKTFQTSRPVQFLFLLRHDERTAWAALVGCASPQSSSLRRYHQRPPLFPTWVLV